MHDLKSLMNLSGESSDDDDGNDCASLAAIAKSIFEPGEQPVEPPPPEEAEHPIYDLKALMDMSSGSSDDESNDYITLAAIAQNILEHAPSSDEGEEEEDPYPPEPPKTASPGAEEPSPPGPAEEPSPRGAFVFGGRALSLQGVRDGDSIEYRVEALRQFLEQGIGLEKFTEAYQFITEGADGLEPAQVDAQMRRIFSTPELLAYYPLIQQLIVCEESAQEE
jgi:hypothetical protein